MAPTTALTDTIKFEQSLLDRRPWAELPSRHWRYRLGYVPSTESLTTQQNGQDYLELRFGVDSKRNLKFVFAICDGVGSSYRGDVAARSMGDWLCNTMWGKWGDTISAVQLGDNLWKRLKEMPPEVVNPIDDEPIPDDIPALMRSALTRQREVGSQTMFIGGRLTQGKLSFASCGDLRLFVLDDEFNSLYTYRPDTDSRWSSKRGVIGEIVPHVIDDPEMMRHVRHIIAHSDGLKDAELWKLSDAELSDHIGMLQAREDSDDISYVHIELTDPPVQRPLFSE
ncbi:MAG: hypothetical protein WA009_01385 [Phototrophicaceae bacterium]